MAEHKYPQVAGTLATESQWDNFKAALQCVNYLPNSGKFSGSDTHESWCELAPKTAPLDYKSEFFAWCVWVATKQIVGKVEHISPTVTPVISQSYPGAVSDFYGLPTDPICIYRTGDEWPVPQGPWPGAWVQRVPREARPVFNHPLRDVWPKLHIEVYEFLDSIGVIWSTIDPVRFAEEGKKETGPVHLWIGVIPMSLSFEDAQAAAVGCKQILANADFPDIEIAFRESLYIRSSGPQLLKHNGLDPIADIQYPFTSSLGIQIATKDSPRFEGTGALYFRESSQSERVFLLTTRHVALPPPIHSNQLYSRENLKPTQRRIDIVILGGKAYPDAIEGIMGKIGREFMFVETCQTELDYLGEAIEGEEPWRTSAREVYQAKLVKAKQTILDVNNFHRDMTRHWTTPRMRVLGYVLHAPPIAPATGPKQFMEDWALIDLDLDKINWDTFKGNVVYFGSKISSADFMFKMHPHPKGQLDFKYPLGGLLQVKGVVEEAELRSPKQLDANGEECLLVVKNGKTTGVTFGRLTGIESVIREYGEDGLKRTSLEVAVYPYSHKDGAFSNPGDSGSIVVDGEGRLVGLLTGGAGTTESSDVTYITPYFWLEERVKKVFPSCFLYPIVDF